MSVTKKYFWLKLKNNFFDREEIKLIEAMINGKDYIIFYMKLLLKSIENDGKLFFRNTIPYSPEMLASITNTNIDTVKISVNMFLELGMMEKWDDGTLFMVETQNMIGNETKWAEYKRVERQNKAEIGHCPNESKKIPIKLELKLEKNIDKKFSLLLSPSKKEKIVDFKTTKELKKHLIEKFDNTNFVFTIGGYQSLIIQNGFLHNTVSQKDLSSKDAIQVWGEIFNYYREQGVFNEQ